MIDKLLKDYKATIESEIDRLYPSVDTSWYKVVIDASRYSLTLGGKRIRPIIMLEFCKLFGGDIQKVINFAVALEMIHTYSLIHDDLPAMDNDAYQTVTDPSAYVKFKLVGEDTYLRAWTTTPWTIPANLAICGNEKFEYEVISAMGRYFVIAKDLRDNFLKEMEITEYTVLRTLTGADLEGMTYKHPLFDRVSPVILGDHVTDDAGTGCVHTAPGHGEDDFNVGRCSNPLPSRKYGSEAHSQCTLAQPLLHHHPCCQW